MYLTKVITVYELPNDGEPVGHIYQKDGWLKEYGIPDMAIYYPTDNEGI